MKSSQTCFADHILREPLGLEQLPNRALQGARRECERCRGTGRAAQGLLVGGPSREDSVYRAICPICGGTGRMRLRTK
jgi:hypothetical protein